MRGHAALHVASMSKPWLPESNQTQSLSPQAQVAPTCAVVLARVLAVALVRRRRRGGGQLAPLGALSLRPQLAGALDTAGAAHGVGGWGREPGSAGHGAEAMQR